MLRLIPFEIVQNKVELLPAELHAEGSFQPLRHCPFIVTAQPATMGF
jgi:hypothetical protein